MIRDVVRVTAVTGMLTVRVVGAAYVPMVTANCSLGAIFGCKSCVNVMATCVPSALTVIALATGATGAAAEATFVPTTVKPLASRAQLIAATPSCLQLRRKVMRLCRETPNNTWWLSVGITVNKLSVIPNFIRTGSAYAVLF